MRKDYAMHMAVGGFLGLMLIPFIQAWALLVCLIVAISKEVIYDKLMKRGDFDLRDIGWTMALPCMFYFMYDLGRTI